MKNIHRLGEHGGEYMANEAVSIKGTRDGIVIIIEENTDYESAKELLYQKIDKSKAFFSGCKARLKVKNPNFGKDEVGEIKRLLTSFGMSVQKVPSINSRIYQNQVLLLKKTLRSGQKITHNGSVVLLGDVNPGSEIVATGDILILGHLRGMAHAGAQGDKTSLVAAFRLQPTQLRIANFISRPPEGKEQIPEVPEVARLKNDIIVIEPYFLMNSESIKKTGGD